MHGHVNVIILVFFTIFATRVNCEIFSSIEQLEKLAVYEKLMLKELTALADVLNDGLVNR